MMKIITLLAMVLLLPLKALAEDPMAHVEKNSVAFVSAFNSGDAAALAALYTEDGALFPPGSSRVDGREAIQAFWQGAIDAGMTLLELGPVEVESRADMATEVGKLVLRVPGEEGTTDIQGNYILVWKRSGHTWQIHRDIWNTL